MAVYISHDGKLNPVMALGTAIRWLVRGIAKNRSTRYIRKGLPLAGCCTMVSTVVQLCHRYRPRDRFLLLATSASFGKEFSISPFFIMDNLPVAEAAHNPLFTELPTADSVEACIYFFPPHSCQPLR